MGMKRRLQYRLQPLPREEERRPTSRFAKAHGPGPVPRLDLASPGCGAMSSPDVRVRPDALGQRSVALTSPPDGGSASTRGGSSQPSDTYCPSGYPALKPCPHPADEGKPLALAMG